MNPDENTTPQGDNAAAPAPATPAEGETTAPAAPAEGEATEAPASDEAAA